MFHLSYVLFTDYELRASQSSWLGFFNDAGCMAALEAGVQDITCKRLDCWKEDKSDWLLKMHLRFKSQLIIDVVKDIRKQTRCLLGKKKKTKYVSF